MYPFIFRTFFARMDPENAHNLVARFLKTVDRVGAVPFLRLLTKPDASLRVTTMGLAFESPFGLAAGFDKNASMFRPLWGFGFGHIEVGTVTALAQDGNPRPRLFRLIEDRSLINRMGFNNQGAAQVAPRLKRRGPGPIVGVNIGKSRVVDVDAAEADYVTSATLLAPLADYLVVNVSSPNTPGLRGLQEIDKLEPLLAAVKNASGSTPVLVKIAPDLTDEGVDSVANLATRLGLAGIIATNTTLSREGLRAPARRIDDIGAGGLSGPPVAARSREILVRLRALVPADMCLISVGGVESAADVADRLAAGANLVQGYTAYIYRGPFWARQITRGLVAR